MGEYARLLHVCIATNVIYTHIPQSPGAIQPLPIRQSLHPRLHSMMTALLTLRSVGIGNWRIIYMRCDQSRPTQWLKSMHYAPRTTYYSGQNTRVVDNVHMGMKACIITGRIARSLVLTFTCGKESHGTSLPLKQHSLHASALAGDGTVFGTRLVLSTTVSHSPTSQI